MIKKILLLSMIIHFCNCLNAQLKTGGLISGDTSNDYILFDGKDTIFCYVTNIDYKFHGKHKFEYKDNNGKLTKISDDEMSSLKAYRVGRFEFVRTPPNVSGKPVKYYEYLFVNPCIITVNGKDERIEGKIKILSSGHHMQIKYENKNERNVILIYKYEAIEKVLKFEDGTYINVNKKNYNEIILPRLNQCQSFKDAYKKKVESGDIFFKKGTYKDTERHIDLYNEVCK